MIDNIIYFLPDDHLPVRLDQEHSLYFSEWLLPSLSFQDKFVVKDVRKSPPISCPGDFTTVKVLFVGLIGASGFSGWYLYCLMIRHGEQWNAVSSLSHNFRGASMRYLVIIYYFRLSTP